jgi:hypothetical protein
MKGIQNKMGYTITKGNHHRFFSVHMIFAQIVTVPAKPFSSLSSTAVP